MIPATMHHTLFKDHATRPVIAWDDDGYALILGRRGQLVRANGEPGFIAIAWDEVGPVIGIAPANGWVAEFLSSEGHQTTLPLAGMAIRSTGEAFPLVIYPDGRCDDPQGDRTFKRIYHPGHDTEPPTEP